jgi:hypothetical protein
VEVHLRCARGKRESGCPANAWPIKTPLTIFDAGNTVPTVVPDEPEAPPEVLPKLSPLKGLKFVNPEELLSQPDREKLQVDLDDLARIRRQAEANTGSLRLG